MARTKQEAKMTKEEKEIDRLRKIFFENAQATPPKYIDPRKGTNVRYGLKPYLKLVEEFGDPHENNPRKTPKKPTPSKDGSDEDKKKKKKNESEEEVDKKKKKKKNESMEDEEVDKKKKKKKNESMEDEEVDKKKKKKKNESMEEEVDKKKKKKKNESMEEEVDKKKKKNENMEDDEEVDKKKKKKKNESMEDEEVDKKKKKKKNESIEEKKNESMKDEENIDIVDKKKKKKNESMEKSEKKNDEGDDAGEDVNIKILEMSIDTIMKQCKNKEFEKKCDKKFWELKFNHDRLPIMHEWKKSGDWAKEYKHAKAAQVEALKMVKVAIVLGTTGVQMSMNLNEEQVKLLPERLCCEEANIDISIECEFDEDQHLGHYTHLDNNTWTINVGEEQHICVFSEVLMFLTKLHYLIMNEEDIDITNDEGSLIRKNVEDEKLEKQLIAYKMADIMEL